MSAQRLVRAEGSSEWGEAPSGILGRTARHRTGPRVEEELAFLERTEVQVDPTVGHQGPPDGTAPFRTQVFEVGIAVVVPERAEGDCVEKPSSPLTVVLVLGQKMGKGQRSDMVPPSLGAKDQSFR